MTSDPAKHVFGMAYCNKIGKIIYPYIVKNAIDEYTQVRDAFNELVRSPEHDLIHATVADKLAEALKVIGDLEEEAGRKYGNIWTLSNEMITEYARARGEME